MTDVRPTVRNKRWGRAPGSAIYVGRPTKWGNPFAIGRDGDRDEVVDAFEEHLRNSPALLDALDELTGRDLVCWCAPKRCHADVLLAAANDPDWSTT